MAKNQVILHQFPPTLRAPSGSPFALKLETWLRMAKIEYTNQAGMEFSSKGKIPWIEFNGTQVADSQFIIEFLSDKLDNKDLSGHLSDEQRAVERAFLKMTEESLFWCMVLYRLVYEPNPELTGFPEAFYTMASETIKKRSKAQGYGLHSKEEVTSIAIAELKAINTYIGRKKFFFGDRVCNLDAALFGMLAQFIYNDRGPLNQYINEKCPNIVRYIETIRTEFWPDWNERLSKPRRSRAKL